MMRQSSHSSSVGNSTASPKTRFGLFKKKLSTSSHGSREEYGSSDKIVDSQASDKIPTSPLFSLPDLDLTRSNSGLLSPDSFVAATHDSEYRHLRGNIQRIRKSKAPSGADPKKVDAAWDVYKEFREETLQLCKSLLEKSQKHERNASLESSIGPLDTRSSHSGSVTETALPYQVNEQWLSAINEYKSIQESLLETIHASLAATHKTYEPKASEADFENFLVNKSLRNSLTTKWRETSVHRMKSEKPEYWDRYRFRVGNYQTLKRDLQAIQKLFGEAEDGEAPNMAIREYVIEKHGDAILEFANAASEVHPILRFRVSSHLCAANSPLFAQFLSTQKPREIPPIELIGQLPPPPSRHVCKDGMEVKVYRMPQVELNKDNALTILLHAAHMHSEKVPREIDFSVFVSIAEVCLRYHCTQPLEYPVEYQWLPQWLHLIGDDNIAGFVIISYAFGLRRIFTRMSKSAILIASSDEDIQNKESWPQAVRDRIKATRAAKIAQIQECCAKAVGEYFQPPAEFVDRRASLVGSLKLTSLPRCPRGSHLCDATNLGWLMLVYNELQILPNIMSTVGFRNLAAPPRRSLKELVDCLRLMPSAPQVHSGACDYAAAFRSDINDIYNSVQGLTLRDVSGKSGWALSKHAGPTEDRHQNRARDLFELEAPLEYQKETIRSVALSNEDISLRILYHLDDLEDLSAAAMIDKTFYQAYKKNEALLLKNVMKAVRRRTMSQVTSDTTFRMNLLSPSMSIPVRPRISIPMDGDEPKSLTTNKSSHQRPTSGASRTYVDENIYDATPPFSPITNDHGPMSLEEANNILYPDDDGDNDEDQRTLTSERTEKQIGDRNEKCLVGDVAHIEDKARMVEDDKHLRHEKDEALGLGAHQN